MTNAHRQTARQTHKVITYQDFNRCQQSAENSIKYHFGNLLLKILLHPIVYVYTRKCAANIVEKYERGLVVGSQRFALASNVNSFIDKCVTYEYQRTYCVNAEKMCMPIFIVGFVRP